MSELSVDQIREAIPDLDELRPLLDHIVARSEPDPSRAWSGSGRLGTLGSRLVATADLGRKLREVVAAEARHLEGLYGSLAQALTRLGQGDVPGTVDALLTAARLEEERDRPAQAKAYAEAAARLAARGPDLSRRAVTLRRCARAARAQGSLEEAGRLYRQSYETAITLADPRGAAEAAVGAGNSLEEQGHWAEAESWYTMALESLAPLPEPVPEQWHAWLNLHIVARSTGRLDESVALLERAEAVADEVDPTASAPFLGNARGQLLMARGGFNEAEAQFRAALAVTDDARAEVTIRLNLAEALLAQGRGLDAAEQARRAEQGAIAARLVPKLPEVYRMLGRVASHEEDEGAFVLFERALEIVRDRGLPTLEEALTLQAYADCEAKRGEPERARELGAAAARRFEELGIAHRRRAWVDVFGPGTDHNHSLTSLEADHED